MLGDRKRIMWGWNTPWDGEYPDQESLVPFIKHLNSWRRLAGRPYLVYGRMVKPFPVEGGRDLPLVTLDGKTIPFPSLFTSRWVSPQGEQAQFIINCMDTAQNFRIHAGKSSGHRFSVLSHPEGIPADIGTDESGYCHLSIDPFSAIMIKMN
jgi:hypothetical protein